MKTVVNFDKFLLKIYCQHGKDYVKLQWLIMRYLTENIKDGPNSAAEALLNTQRLKTSLLRLKHSNPLDEFINFLLFSFLGIHIGR